MSMRLFLCSLFIIQGTSAFAAAMKYSYADDVQTHSAFKAKEFSLPKMKDDDLKKLRSSESMRKPAQSSVIGASKMSAKLKELEDELFKLKTSEEVDAFLVKLDNNYDSYPTDVKYYITQVMPMRAFRGIFYRIRTLFEKKSDFAHAQAITIAKTLARDMNVLLPEEHIEAGFEYIAAPFYQNTALVQGFKKEADLQVWMVNELLPQLVKSIGRLEALDLTKVIVWDQRIIFGPQSFADDLNRFRLIGEFEKNLSLAGIYDAISRIGTIRAYSMENAIELFREVGFVYGLDGFGPFSQADGASAKKVTQVMRKSLFARTGTLLPDGQEWMNLSYQAAQKSLHKFSIAWENSSTERKDESSYIFNTAFLNINRAELDENLHMIKRIMTSKGPESLRSSVTGELVQFDYSKMYTRPPQDMKIFLPVAFDEVKEKTKVVKLGNGQTKTIKYRNYHYHEPTEWNAEAYSVYFPSINSSADVKSTVRTLSHLGGNWLTLR